MWAKYKWAVLEFKSRTLGTITGNLFHVQTDRGVLKRELSQVFATQVEELTLIYQSHEKK